MTGKIDFSEGEKELFCEDLKSVCKEYFEGDDKYAVDVVTTANGVSVCIVFDAARIRNFKRAK